MAKARVVLNYTVELDIEGKDMDAIEEWILNTTPEEACRIAEEQNKITSGYGYGEYSEEIVCELDDDAEVDIAI